MFSNFVVLSFRSPYAQKATKTRPKSKSMSNINTNTNNTMAYTAAANVSNVVKADKTGTPKTTKGTGKGQLQDWTSPSCGQPLTSSPDVRAPPYEPVSSPAAPAPENTVSTSAEKSIVDFEIIMMSPEPQQKMRFVKDAEPTPLVAHGTSVVQQSPAAAPATKAKRALFAFSDEFKNIMRVMTEPFAKHDNPKLRWEAQADDEIGANMKSRLLMNDDLTRLLVTHLKRKFLTWVCHTSNAVFWSWFFSVHKVACTACL